MCSHSLPSTVLFLACSPVLLCQQSSFGIIDGIAVDQAHQPIPHAAVQIRGRPDSVFELRSDDNGRFVAAVPYGRYEISAEGGTPASLELQIEPGRLSRCVLVLGQTAAEPLNRQEYAEHFSVSGHLLMRDPTAVVQPLNLTGLADARLSHFSQRAFPWTWSTYRLQGMNATDPYETGNPMTLGDIEALETIQANDSVVPLFVKQSQERWHARITSAGTGPALASDNLPPSATRGAVTQTERFNWLTHDNVQIGGPIGSRADVFLSGTGQWSSQTVPAAPRGSDQNNRLLYGTARGRIQLTSRDQIDAQYTGSRMNTSNWTLPAGLEALTGWRVLPSLDTNPYGFGGLSEVDHLDPIQVGWTRQLSSDSAANVLQVRYQFVPVHLDTNTASVPGQSVSDLLGGVTGLPPLTNLAIRTSQQLTAAFETGEFHAGVTQRLALGGSAEWARSTNRFHSPDDLNLITAAGIPSYAVELNTPSNSKDNIRSMRLYAQDTFRIRSFLSVNAGVTGDFSRGSLPAQSSPQGIYFPQRQFPATGNLITWNSASPLAGFAVNMPGFSRLTFRGSYRRTYAPLAGRYLDYGNPNGLSGVVYQWTDRNGDGQFEPNEAGTLLRHFGGNVSSIDPSLRRPYADEFRAGASISLPLRTSAQIELYRRDDKDRIATINTGVPASSYTPVTINDPGPDAIPGTFDDSTLVVWNQSPSTFGNDQYLLTNPKGLRMLYEGLAAQVAVQQRYIDIYASFTAEKSYGPTNPGNGVLENDPGVIGSLYQDPNTLINAAGRDFFDRAYIGKVQTVSHLPPWLGGFYLSNLVTYLDGLVFARELLVAGLNQGPFVVPATVRGSPEGGNRAEYVLNWNLRLSRIFPLAFGRLEAAADVMNATNFHNRIQESDVTGPFFNERLPAAIQPARFVRLGITYDF